MRVLLVDPTGTVAKVQQRQNEPALGPLKGKKVGYIFNQHASALAFWKALEAEVQQRIGPSSAYRIYKDNTWAPAPKAKVDQLVLETDYALVGVGA